MSNVGIFCERKNKSVTEQIFGLMNKDLPEEHWRRPRTSKDEMPTQKKKSKK